MKIYKSQSEVEKDIKDGMLTIEGDVRFECNISIDASIHVIGNIDAWNIAARNIDAGNITARYINAWNISYYAFCSVYQNIKCKSISGRRTPHSEPICLEGKLEIIKEPETIEINGKKYNKEAVEERLKELETID